MEDTLRQAVEVAAKRPEVAAAVRAIYDAVALEIDKRRPACAMSGRCCRFEEYGHRLYVSTVELAAFVAGMTGSDVGPTVGRSDGGKSLSSRILQPPSAPWDGSGCPFQVAKLCGVHAIHPFGCRMYFCDATSTEWQHDAYERFHAQLKLLHERLGVPYFYLEWRGALRALGLAPSPPDAVF